MQQVCLGNRLAVFSGPANDVVSAFAALALRTYLSSVFSASIMRHCWLCNHMPVNYFARENNNDVVKFVEMRQAFAIVELCKR